MKCKLARLNVNSEDLTSEIGSDRLRANTAGSSVQIRRRRRPTVVGLVSASATDCDEFRRLRDDADDWPTSFRLLRQPLAAAERSLIRRCRAERSDAADDPD